MTTRIEHGTDGRAPDRRGGKTRDLPGMRFPRAFLLWTTIALTAIGVLEGVVVSIVLHLGLTPALLFIGARIVLSLVWVPIAVLAVLLLDGHHSPTRRVALLIALGLASLLVDAWAAGLLRYVGAPIAPFSRRIIGRSDTALFFYLAIVGAAWAAAARRRQIASELAAARIREAVSNAQLHVLTL